MANVFWVLYGNLQLVRCSPSPVSRMDANQRAANVPRGRAPVVDVVLVSQTAV